MNDFANEKLELDSKKLNAMKARIILLERQNNLKNIYSDTEMIERIKKIIIEEAKRCF